LARNPGYRLWDKLDSLQGSSARDASGEFPQFFMAAPEKLVGGELLEILEA